MTDQNQPERMNKLLADHASKKITLEELERECAYWFLDCFPEIRNKPLPSMPQKYEDYSRLQDYEKKQTPKEFWYIPEIKNYLDQKFLIQNENKANLQRLKEFKSFIPEGDFISHSKYQQKINEMESHNA